MYERSFPREIAVKKEIVSNIEKRFQFKFPPLYKQLLINFNTSLLQFYPTINKWFKHAGLNLDIYMSDEKHKNYLFNSINSPLRIYNDLIAYPHAIDAIKDFNQLVIGNFDNGSLFVGVGETNQDFIYKHIIENGDLISKKIEDNIFQFISKYKITLPTSTESMERGLLDKYWLTLNNIILLDIKKFEPREQEQKYFQLDELVDNIYNEIMNYVQG